MKLNSLQAEEKALDRGVSWGGIGAALGHQFLTGG